MSERVVLTYGTFDLFHVGHLRLLNRLKSLGSKLIVGVSTDEFNKLKGKETIIKFSDRVEILKNIKCVDDVIAEESWEQKINDIEKYNVSVFGMGDDWISKFDHLKSHCEVVYLPRTDGISSTEIKSTLKVFDKSHVNELKNALDVISSVIQKISYE